MENLLKKPSAPFGKKGESTGPNQGGEIKVVGSRFLCQKSISFVNQVQVDLVREKQKREGFRTKKKQK